MALGNDITRLSRTIEELAEAVTIGLRTGRGLSAEDRQAARAEIEVCVQRLDELRTLLGEGRR